MKVYIPTEINPDDLPKGEVIAITIDELPVKGRIFDRIIICAEDRTGLDHIVSCYLKEVEIEDDPKVIEEMAEKYQSQQGTNYPVSEEWKRMIRTQIQSAYQDGCTKLLKQLES